MSAPRLVVVHRRTQLAELLAEHSTMAAVEFFLETRGQRVEPLVAADEAQNRALAAATNAVPIEWRQAVVERAQLSRFLFEPDDVVVVVGQDGLVPNVAKYLAGQLVFGVSPGAPGLLCTHGVAELKPFFGGTAEFAVSEGGTSRLRLRWTMASRSSRSTRSSWATAGTSLRGIGSRWASGTRCSPPPG